MYDRASARTHARTHVLMPLPPPPYNRCLVAHVSSWVLVLDSAIDENMMMNDDNDDEWW